MKRIIAIAAMMAATMAMAEPAANSGGAGGSPAADATETVQPSNRPTVQPSNGLGGVTNAAARAHSMHEKTGGAVIRPLPAGSKAIVFLDARKDTSETAFFRKAVSRIEAMTSLHIKTATGTLESLGKTDDVVIALVDGGETTLYPDRMLAIVPARIDLEATGKAIWQATIALFSLYGKQVNDFNGMGIVRSGAEAYGIPQVQRVFYVRALEEGWAPPPADEYQKALWEKHRAAKGGADK